MSDKAEKLCPMRKDTIYAHEGTREALLPCIGTSCAWYIDRSDYQGCAIAKPKG